MVQRVAVIGAGPSGLTSVKACLDEGMEPTCYESSDDIGGLWKFKEVPEPSKAETGLFSQWEVVTETKDRLEEKHIFEAIFTQFDPQRTTFTNTTQTPYPPCLSNIRPQTAWR